MSFLSPPQKQVSHSSFTRSSITNLQGSFLTLTQMKGKFLFFNEAVNPPKFANTSNNMGLGSLKSSTYLVRPCTQMDLNHLVHGILQSQEYRRLLFHLYIISIMFSAFVICKSIIKIVLLAFKLLLNLFSLTSYSTALPSLLSPPFPP